MSRLCLGYMGDVGQLRGIGKRRLHVQVCGWIESGGRHQDWVGRGTGLQVGMWDGVSVPGTVETLKRVPGGALGTGTRMGLEMVSAEMKAGAYQRV